MKRINFLVLLIAISLIVYGQKSIPNSPNSGTKGLLTVSVVTADPGGLWDPENVLAIWLEDNSGNLVNTMMYFTTNTWNSATSLSEWWKKIGSHWSNDMSVLALYTKSNLDGISGPTQVDGITTPTRPSVPAYGYRFCYWGETFDLTTVADGTYTIKMECANDFAPVGTGGHRMASYSFVKGTANILLLPPDVLPSFKSVVINWVPNVTGLKNVDISNTYTVFPNPAISYLFVKGEDIKALEVMTLSGKKLFKTNQKSVNIALLPCGTYLIHIYTSKGIIIKKFTKQ